ncbi:MAG: glycosyltransferase [Pseudomonadota bacterium]
MPVPLVSVVIPAFNAQSFIAGTVQKLQEFFKAYAMDGEILVVDDGSMDGTAEAIPKAPNVRLFTFNTNQGKGAALREGFRHAYGQVVLFTDADLPYGVEPIGVALYCIKERGYQAVIGDRSLPSSSYGPTVPALRWILSSVCSLTVRTLLIGGIADTQCGFKAFQGDVARELSRLMKVSRFASDIEILYVLLKYRLDIKRIPVKASVNASSTVHAFADSLVAAWDICRVRAYWSLGRYFSPILNRVFEESGSSARRNAAAWLNSTRPR